MRARDLRIGEGELAGNGRKIGGLAVIGGHWFAKNSRVYQGKKRGSGSPDVSWEAEQFYRTTSGREGILYQMRDGSKK
jgi:hypothetical protein